MGNNWTNDQLDAINSYGKATVVSAAAGSGKTAVLVERTIRMLSDENLGIEADRLLAVTFTNDAANNMKEKLSSAMTKALEENSQNHWVQKQKDLLSLATICTIDAFCMELVKNNINDLEISGNFTLLDNQENNLLTEKAFGEASQFFFKNCPDKMKILMDNFAEETDKEVIECGMALHDFKGSLPFPEMWLRNSKENFKQVLEESYDEQYLQDVKPLTNALKGTYQVLEKNQEKINTDTYSPLIESLKALRKAVDEAAKKGKDFTQFDEFIPCEEFKFPRRPSKNKCTDEENEIYDQINGVKTSLNKALKKLREVVILPEDVVKSEQKLSEDIFECLWDFVNKAEEILWEYKLDRNKFYFSDITRLTIKLLAKETENGFEKTELAKRITDEERYKMILIDEFQDVNNLQSVIFKCISDTDDVNVLGKNVFVVGDMKQSIYSFRQSNPQIFDEARNLAREEQYADVCRAIYLKKNFRSRKNVIDFTNFIFKKAMTLRVGEVDYDVNEQLELGANYPNENDPNYDTEIILFNSSASDEDDENSTSESVSIEYKIVAEKVRDMLYRKVPVYENGISRPCRPGDFCVLLRTKKLVNEYIKAFEKYDIQAVGDSVSGYLGAREISLALSILKILDNPMNDIPFVAVCLSPVFGFTTDEIAQIRRLDKFKKFYSIFLGIARQNDGENYGYDKIKIDDEKIIKKCTEAVELIKKLRFYASGMSLEKLVRKVYDVTDLMSIANSFENSQQKKANLRMLVRYADNYEKNTGGGLNDFLRYLDNISKSGNDFDEALTISSGEQTVSVKTIHKSKGLEYPFVIVGDMAKEYNIPKRSAKIMLNEKAGFGISLRDENEKLNHTTMMYDYCYTKNVLEQKSEELRILYVALTRAKEKLILPLCLRTRGGGRAKKFIKKIEDESLIAPYDIENLMSYSEIIYVSLFANGCVTAPGVNVEEYEETITVSDDKKTKFIPARADNTLVSEIIKGISFDENVKDTETVSKLSVTEFVREIEKGNTDKEITYFSPIPDVGIENPKSSAAQKGTDTHLFMELCDFEKASKSVTDELNRLVDSHMLTQKQAENVNVDTVKAFFESEIFELCKNGENIWREKDFKVKLSDLELDNSPLKMYNDKDVMLQGIADLIVQTKMGISIVDYKTDNVKEESELIERYFVQLLLYQKAFEKIFGQKVNDCFIYSFKLQKSIKIDFESLQKIHIDP